MFKEYRRYFTMAVGFTFLVVSLTGVFFKFFFKTHELEEIHGWLGIAMVGAAIFHIMHNWTSIRLHFRSPGVRALIIPVVVLICFFWFKPKERRAGSGDIIKKLSQAEMGKIADVFGKDLNSVIPRMRADGFDVESPQETLDNLAKRNKKPTGAVLSYFVN